MKLLTEVPTAPVGAGAGTLAFRSSLMVDRLRVSTSRTGASFTAVTETATVSLAAEKAVDVPGFTLVPDVPELWSQARSVSALPALPLKLVVGWK
ncbi:hypothetical protein D3C86_2009200 [compost metagenome]